VKQTQAAVDKYAKLYPDAEIEMTGHSLGGTVVQHIAVRL
jgi:putative lipase involved disintegration of autophagic bodies